jgi:hypothetical protein
MLISPTRYIPASACIQMCAHACIHHTHILGNSRRRVSSLGGESIGHCEKKYWLFLLIRSVYVPACIHTCVRALIHTRTHICTHAHTDTQGDSRGNVNILRRDSVGHCETRSSYEHVSNSDCLTRCSCLNLCTRVGKCNEVDEIFEHSLQTVKICHCCVTNLSFKH